MADYLFVNGTDAQIDNINAGGDDVVARSVAAATATSAELVAYLGLTTAVAVCKTDISAAEKISLAWTLLKSAGVNLGDQITSASDLATPEKRNKFRLKAGRQEAVNLFESIG